MKTKTFKGQINGKEYTDRDEFLKALDEVRDSKKSAYNVSYEEKESDVDEAVENVTIDDLTDAVNSFRNLFGWSAVNSDIVEKAANILGIKFPEKPTPAKKEEPAKKAVDFNKFVFPYTTYKFTGTQVDDDELDKFSSLLKSRIDEFTEISKTNVVPVTLLDTFGDKIETYKKTKATLMDKLTKEGDKVDAYESILNSLSVIGDKPTEDFKARVAAETQRYDAIDAETDYCDLMIDYYNSLLNSTGDDK